MRHLFEDLSIILWGLLLAAGLLLWVAILADAQPSCSHWASPGGSATSSQCTDAAPCRIMTWLNNSAFTIPGATLCLKSGIYTGSESMISIPESFAGTSEKPITIRALDPGKVTIDGQDSNRPINTKGSYGVIQGVNAIRGDNENVMVRGNHWLIKDLMTWNVGSNGDTNIHMSGSDNTVEDCGSFGPARKSIAAGAAGGDRNTVRRCWARWEANEHPTSNPSNTYEIGYGQNGVTFENTIATWNTKGRVTEPEGLGEILSTKNSKWLGSIFYLTKNDSYAPSVLMFGTTDAGSHAQQGNFNPTSNLLFKHILAYIDPQHSKFGSMRAFYFAEGTDPGHPPGTGNVLSDLTSIAGGSNSFSSSFPTSRVQHGTSIAAAIGSGKSMWTDSYAGPGICKRYLKGQLTNQGLWPWPSDKRISDALAQAGYPAMSVTATMEQLFGPIPEQCRSSGPGTGPGPAPGVPVPPTAVQASVDGSSVLVEWTDTQGAVATGYTLERKVPPGPYAQITDAPGPEARSYVDRSPVRGQTNCYVVYARGAAGPSGFSQEACAEVPIEGGPPGSGDGIPLSCEGSLEAGGRISMTCHPTVGRR